MRGMIKLIYLNVEYYYIMFIWWDNIELDVLEGGVVEWINLNRYSSFGNIFNSKNHNFWRKMRYIEKIELFINSSIIVI